MITLMRTELKSCQDQYKEARAEIKRTAAAAKFYDKMQEAILENPILQGEWDRFCSFLKLSLEDGEEHFS
jgi:hypothetical protein